MQVAAINVYLTKLYSVRRGKLNAQFIVTTVSVLHLDKESSIILM